MTNVSFLGEHDPLFLQLVKDAPARVNHLTQPFLAKAFRGEHSAETLLARILAERATQTPAKWGRKRRTHEHRANHQALPGRRLLYRYPSCGNRQLDGAGHFRAYNEAGQQLISGIYFASDVL